MAMLLISESGQFLKQKVKTEIWTNGSPQKWHPYWPCALSSEYDGLEVHFWCLQSQECTSERNMFQGNIAWSWYGQPN